MDTLILRVGGLSQTWAGYRLVTNKHGNPTSVIPRKSGIAGLIGAATGERDYLKLLTEFDLHVRVDWNNPAVDDLQVATPLPVRAQEPADRNNKMRTALNKTMNPNNRSSPNGMPSLTSHAFVPHSENIITITSNSATEWLEAFKEPTFMLSLGRRADTPTYPFILGVTDQPPTEALTELPTATPQHHGGATTRTYLVAGDYHAHEYTQLTNIPQPTRTTREEQLEWATRNLLR